MEIIVGKYSGFCNGVKNTVNKTIEELNNNNSIYSLGDIVHNEVVINDLKEKGLMVKDNINDIPNDSKVIIRAHGESIDVYQKAKEKNIKLIDLTCGRVKLIHNKILSKKNSFVIIIGKKNHPETIAHKSYSKNSYVIEAMDDINGVYDSYLTSGKESVYVVAQTTYNSELFDKIVNKLKEIFANIEIDKTICNATSIRQNETMEIAKYSDKVIVIGGKNSSNTKELEMVAKKYCDNVYLVQTVYDLDKDMFDKDDVIGVVAGASTPDNLIQEVVKFLENIYNHQK